MRKVLFATTALVALGGVSAASADISVSAANEFQYKSWSDSTTSTANDSSMTNKQSYKISASAVLDNGMSLSSYIGTDGSITSRIAASPSLAILVQLGSMVLRLATNLQPLQTLHLMKLIPTQQQPGLQRLTHSCCQLTKQLRVRLFHTCRPTSAASSSRWV